MGGEEERREEGFEAVGVRSRDAGVDEGCGGGEERRGGGVGVGGDGGERRGAGWVAVGG